MEKRFFFDWVNVNRARVSINYRSQDAVDIDSHPALAALAGLNQTHFWT
jgi:hypothetical protein